MSRLIQPQRDLVGRRIRQARIEAGLSHDALGARVGTTRQHLIKLEKGMHLPRPEMLAKIARETGKPEAFFTDEDDEESSMDFAEAIQMAFDLAVEKAATQAAEKLALRLAG